tara:strand:- start:152 stop:280 length:129 start_codon:yes stop_codon:yes gene_type:complete
MRAKAYAKHHAQSGMPCQVFFLLLPFFFLRLGMFLIFATVAA